jgi:hypothetical protein
MAAPANWANAKHVFGHQVGNRPQTFHQMSLNRTESHGVELVGVSFPAQLVCGTAAASDFLDVH